MINRWKIQEYMAVPFPTVQPKNGEDCVCWFGCLFDFVYDCMRVSVFWDFSMLWVYVCVCWGGCFLVFLQIGCYFCWAMLQIGAWYLSAAMVDPLMG